MPSTRVPRPVVRSFKARFSREAALHVRSGGHAVYWETPQKAHFVFPAPSDSPMDLGHWSVLDMGLSKYSVATRGPFRGFASLVVPRRAHAIVKRRAHRDSILEGPTHEVDLDCLACGACCRDNYVELEDEDEERFRAAGREDLLRRPFARRVDGKTVLVLLRSKACKQLQDDNKCSIYDIRPSACSQFPMGSECCLFAREDALGVVDGLSS